MELSELIINKEMGITKENIMNSLVRNGIVILEDYYTNEEVSKMEEEFNSVFEKHGDVVDILDKEDCSKDERIFHAEKFSPYLKQRISDDKLFETIVTEYTKVNRRNKKVLLNKVEYKEGEVRNSGAGWHRDNHDCQFKVIVYLSDVNERNGNFQFLTNSSKHHIGYPTPRTTSYNTRFSDEVVEGLIKDNVELINIVGKKGTVLLANTIYIHRGNIIQEGDRKAITQYYF